VCAAGDSLTPEALEELKAAFKVYDADGKRAHG
jgi:hypothetical protein